MALIACGVGGFSPRPRQWSASWTTATSARLVFRWYTSREPAAADPRHAVAGHRVGEPLGAAARFRPVVEVEVVEKLRGAPALGLQGLAQRAAAAVAQFAEKLLAPRVAEPPGGAADRRGQERAVPGLAESGVRGDRFVSLRWGRTEEGGEGHDGGEQGPSVACGRSRHERLLSGSRLAKQLT